MPNVGYKGTLESENYLGVNELKEYTSLKDISML